MKNIWFSSDFHYGHKNIVRGVSEWEDKSQCRNFDTLEEHNETLIANINSVVKPGDDLWFLGDWAFGGLENIEFFRKRILCEKIHVIMGNHDHHIRNNASFKHIFSNVRNLFAGCQEKFIGKIGGKYMTLDHYSHRAWDKGHHGAWMLYGHSHGSLEDYGKRICVDAQFDDKPRLPNTGQIIHLKHEDVLFKTMDVGIDTHPEFRPYHFDEIAKIMSTRSNLLVDHHNSKTN